MRHDTYALSDEVYEHLVFDPHKHVSLRRAAFERKALPAQPAVAVCVTRQSVCSCWQARVGMIR